MTKLGLILAGFGVFGLCVSAGPQAPQAAPANGDNALVKQYCVTCHNDRTKTGGLSLASFEVSDAARHAPEAEKMIRKLRAGMMPPSGARRPEEPALLA